MLFPSAGPDQCSYQRQKSTVAAADVIIAAHQTMFYELPKEVRKDLAVVVVDESWWQAGILPPREVAINSFATDPLRYPVLDRKTKSSHSTSATLDTNDIHTISAKAQRAFEATPEGELLTKAALLSARLTPRNAHPPMPWNGDECMRV